MSTPVITTATLTRTTLHGAPPGLSPGVFCLLVLSGKGHPVGYQSV
jgi:hypothetical protein